MPIARNEATWRSHSCLEKIATLPSVARNDNVKPFLTLTLIAQSAPDRIFVAHFDRELPVGLDLAPEQLVVRIETARLAINPCKISAAALRFTAASSFHDLVEEAGELHHFLDVGDFFGGGGR